MSAILPETGTKVKVEVDTSEIDKCLSSIDSDIFSPVVDIFNDLKKTIEDGANSVADNVAESIKSYQEMWIIQNKTIDTGQMIGTLFVEPSAQNEYNVGPTALSERGFPYPLVIEMGSSKYKGKPFVEPSIQNVEKDIGNIVQKEIINRI
ncbi:MAG: hypothetical protein LBU40_03875 [Methanobrevibacter sp.]|jgi:hypothetical protein|nr:hypothetical protein [Methanobrevibacter sp.]